MVKRTPEGALLARRAAEIVGRSTPPTPNWRPARTASRTTPRRRVPVRAQRPGAPAAATLRRLHPNVDRRRHPVPLRRPCPTTASATPTSPTTRCTCSACTPPRHSRTTATRHGSRVANTAAANSSSLRCRRVHTAQRLHQRRHHRRPGPCRRPDWASPTCADWHCAPTAPKGRKPSELTHAPRPVHRIVRRTTRPAGRDRLRHRTAQHPRRDRPASPSSGRTSEPGQLSRPWSQRLTRPPTPRRDLQLCW